MIIERSPSDTPERRYMLGATIIEIFKGLVDKPEFLETIISFCKKIEERMNKIDKFFSSPDIVNVMLKIFPDYLGDMKYCVEHLKNLKRGIAEIKNGNLSNIPSCLTSVGFLNATVGGWEKTMEWMLN